jgi:hypothetical protein
VVEQCQEGIVREAQGLLVMNANGEYWPVRVRVKGGLRVKVTNVLQLGLIGDAERQPPRPVDFVEEARFTKDDFGNWLVSYGYDPNGPKWRVSAPTSASGS